MLGKRHATVKRPLACEMRRNDGTKGNVETSKRPNVQTSKRPNVQTSKRPNVQTGARPNSTARVMKWTERGRGDGETKDSVHGAADRLDRESRGVDVWTFRRFPSSRCPSVPAYRQRRTRLFRFALGWLDLFRCRRFADSVRAVEPATKVDHLAP